jgi:hypothetical protein
MAAGKSASNLVTVSEMLEERFGAEIILNQRIFRYYITLHRHGIVV